LITGVVTFKPFDGKVGICGAMLDDKDMIPLNNVKSDLKGIVGKYMKLFADRNLDGKMHTSTLPEHKIDLTSNIPIYRRPYRHSFMEGQFVINKVKQWIDKGVCTANSSSEYGFPIVVVPKPPGSKEAFRLAIDFSPLNNVTRKSHYPLPRIDDVITSAKGKYKTKIDIVDGYHNVKLKEKDRYKTAFVSPIGHHEFKVMPLGLKNASQTFQRGIDDILMNEPCLKGVCADAFQDDILIWSDTHVKK
jgi:hypothetical protein